MRAERRHRGDNGAVRIAARGAAGPAKTPEFFGDPFADFPSLPTLGAGESRGARGARDRLAAPVRGGHSPEGEFVCWRRCGRGIKPIMRLRQLVLASSVVVLSSAACGSPSVETGGDTDAGSSGGAATGGATSGATDGLACAPGMSVACTCQNGDVGAQTCADDGQSYGPCACDGGSGSASAGTTTADPTGGTGEPSTGDVQLEKFSFFVTSLKAMQELSGSQDGFGGDLRFGEQGAGAGLRGADKICAAIAEKSMPGASSKGWRAFLSASDDGNGQQVDAIDRVGEGPWYDRLGRLVAATKADLAAERPVGGDPAIVDDLPNEDGVGNHQPDPNLDPVDNHDTLTGSNPQGRLAGASFTCSDWTSAQGQAQVQPRIGHSWPRNANSGRNWISDHNAGGCGPGVNIVQMGGPQPGDYTVGAGGGYGGIYCFALTQ